MQVRQVPWSPSHQEDLGATEGENLPLAGPAAAPLDRRRAAEAWARGKRVMLPV